MNKPPDTIQRIYEKLDANFPPEIEEKLHDILKKSTVKGITDFGEARFAIQGISINRTALKAALKRQSPDIYSVLILGDYIFYHLGEQIVKDYFLTNDIEVIPFGIMWKFRMRSLTKQIIKDNSNIYYSFKTPRFEINNTKYRIAFTKHCIEQVHQRATGGRWNFGALGDSFAFLYNNTYFEKVELTDDSKAIVIYNLCNEGFIAHQLVERIYGNNYDRQKQYYYRVGYLPIEIIDDFAVAKTLLCPGFKKTPEYASLIKSGENRELLKKATENEQSDIAFTYDLELTQKFHQLGIPQVKTIDGVVFKYN